MIDIYRLWFRLTGFCHFRQHYNATVCQFLMALWWT